MHYIRSYWISPCDYKLWEMLESHNIACHGSPFFASRGEYAAMCFHIDESLPAFSLLEPYLPDATSEEYIANHGTAASTHVGIQYYPQYSENDCYEAEWLQMKAVSLKVDPQNGESLFHKFCPTPSHWGASWGVRYFYMHCTQKEFVVSKKVTWGNNQYFSGSYYFGGIFCSERARDILVASTLNGFRFDPVYIKGGKLMQNTFQVRSTYIAPDSAFVPLMDMAERKCPCCGINTLFSTGKKPIFSVRKELLDPDADFYETPPMFAGSDRMGCTGEYLISQRTYRFLNNKCMTRAVEFVPLQSC